MPVKDAFWQAVISISRFLPPGGIQTRTAEGDALQVLRLQAMDMAACPLMADGFINCAQEKIWGGVGWREIYRAEGAYATAGILKRKNQSVSVSPAGTRTVSPPHSK